MKTVVILSALKLWSIEGQKGAPSFFNTVKGYVTGGWRTYLINPNTQAEISEYGLSGLIHLPVPLYDREQPDNMAGKWIYNNRMQRHYNKEFMRRLDDLLPTLDGEEYIIYAYEVAAVPVAKSYSRKYQKKLVTRFQGTILCKLKFGLKNRIGYIHHFRALSTPSDLVIMTNDGTFGDRILQRLGNHSPTKFWRNGVDIDTSMLNDFEVPHTKTDERILLTVSRLANWKRVDRAISALPEVLKVFPKCRLIVVGDGPERENLEELAKKLGVLPHVTFAGSVPHEKIYEYMHMADVFLSLYDLGNVGNPLLEAMICGKPIITLNNGDTASLITNNVNGILLELSEIDRVGESIIALLGDHKRCESLGQKAKEFAEDNFRSWDARIADELETVEALLNA